MRREYLFLEDIEREMCSKFYLAMAAGNPSSEGRVQAMLNGLASEMPWLGSADRSPERLQKELKEKYRLHMEQKERQRKKKQKKEKKT